MKTQIDTRRCPNCKRRTKHREQIGSLRPDPRHPDDRKYDCQDVVAHCLVCGCRQESERCPNLLSGIFSI